MKKRILAAALLAGMSSGALADTDSFVRPMPPHEPDGQFARTRWESLASLTSDYWFGQKVVKISDDRAEISAIRLVNGSGATYVYAMTVRYGDGHVESIPVSKWLYQGESRMSFKLARGHDVRQLTLQTFSWGYSTFQVMGQRSFAAQPPYGEPPPPPPAPVPAHVVVPLARNLTFANSNGYIHLPIGVAKGEFSKIQIESMESNTYIGHLHVTFASGAHQTLEVNKTMARGQVLELDLQGNHSALDAIVVMQNHSGPSIGGGRFSVSLVR